MHINIAAPHLVHWRSSARMAKALTPGCMGRAKCVHHSFDAGPTALPPIMAATCCLVGSVSA
eukprot:1419464-Amphidinium_carterae.1